MRLNRIWNLFLTKIKLSKKIRKRADKYFNRSLREFRKKKKRKPNRNELFLLVVKASHRTIGVKEARKKLEKRYEDLWVQDAYGVHDVKTGKYIRDDLTERGSKKFRRKVIDNKLKLDHNKRQWIRKYLLLKNKIRDNYKIQKK